MLITLAEIGVYLTFIWKVFKFEQPPQKLFVWKKGQNGKRHSHQRNCQQKPGALVFIPPTSPTPRAPDTIRTLRSSLGYGSLIFTVQIARGTKNIENYALKHTTQNKTLSIPSYSSASLSVQYFYHSYAFMSNHIDFFSISKHSTTYRISMPVFPARRNQLYRSAL